MTADAEAHVPPPPRRADRPIFVVGCARSGTTLLQLMLHAHPRIAIPPETRFLVALYDKRADFGDLRKTKNRRKVAKWIVGRRKSKFHDLGLDAQALTRQILAAPPTVGSIAATVYRAYADRHAKPRWGDKRPLYILQLETLTRLFPDAQIVHIIRDGRDVVSSLKRMKFWKSGSVGAIWYWRAAMRAGAKARQTYPADQYHEISYEALVADPQAQLRELCAFLGEDFDDAMLTPHNVASVAVPERKSHHARTHQPVDDRAVSQWKAQLEGWEVNLIELVARRELRAHGYRPSRRVALPSPLKLAAFARYAAVRAARHRRQRARDEAISATYRRPVAAQLP